MEPWINTTNHFVIYRHSKYEVAWCLVCFSSYICSCQLSHMFVGKPKLCILGLRNVGVCRDTDGKCLFCFFAIMVGLKCAESRAAQHSREPWARLCCCQIIDTWTLLQSLWTAMCDVLRGLHLPRAKWSHVRWCVLWVTDVSTLQVLGLRRPFHPENVAQKRDQKKKVILIDLFVITHLRLYT